VLPESPFHRLGLLVGQEGLDKLAQLRVAVFGLGGVGGWAAEGLVRSGVGHLTLVDHDTIDITNLNRQVQAHAGNVGKAKTTELAWRLARINHACSLLPIQEFYTDQNGDDFRLGEFDYVLDCIDSVPSKVDLIMRASRAGARVVSSMGAAFKLDPTQIRCDSIFKTEGCALARIIRRRLREETFIGDVQAVYSPESMEIEDRSVNASAVFVTACFGMALAGVVVREICESP
jgi:tRNA A37 threonylcarbamoyladenosine dehydratase